MKNTLLILSFTLLFLFFGSTISKEVYLNSTVLNACTTDCNFWFFNSFIWSNGSAPGTDDVVFLNLAKPGVYLYLNQSINFTSLDMDGDVVLVLAGYANVSTQNLSISDNSQLLLQDQSTIISTVNTLLKNQAQINITAGAFAQDGQQFFLDYGTSVRVDNGYFGIHAVKSYIYGSLTFAPLTLFFSTSGDIEFRNQTMNFVIMPTIYSATFIYSNITFKLGWRGSRSADLYASTLNIFGPSALVLTNFTTDESSTIAIRATANCSFVNNDISGLLVISSSKVVVANALSASVILAGQSSLYAPTLLTTSVDFQNGEFGEAPNSTIQVTNLLSNGFWSFPQGSIYVSNYALFSGYSLIQGTLTVAVQLEVQGSSISVNGSVNVGYDNYGQRTNNYSSILLVSAQLSADYVDVGDYGMLEVLDSEVHGIVTLHKNATLAHRNSSFYGNLTNHGFIAVRGGLPVGNFAQSSLGTILTYLDLANQSSGYVEASGYASVDGTIAYNVTSAPLSSDLKMLLIVQTGMGVSGAFPSEPVNVANSDHRGSLRYTKNDVFLSFGEEPKGPDSMWWIWIIVAVGILVVGALAGLLIKTYRRKGYTKVEIRG